MCGFVGYEQATLRKYPEWFVGANTNTQLNLVLNDWTDYTAYPAFGGDTNKRIPLLIKENGVYKKVSAIWWFDVFCQDNVSYIGKRTSFNARNLASSFWRKALNERRGVVCASQLGESKLVGKTKHQYLMQSKAPFMLGALYQKLENGDYACAIITRDAHPKMTPYHAKAFPLFLPIDSTFIELWLGDNAVIEQTNNQPLTNKAQSEEGPIERLLKSPKLYPNLHVQRVKTYKGKQPVGKLSDTLVSDFVDSQGALF